MVPQPELRAFWEDSLMHLNHLEPPFALTSAKANQPSQDFRLLKRNMSGFWQYVHQMHADLHICTYTYSIHISYNYIYIYICYKNDVRCNPYLCPCRTCAAFCPTAHMLGSDAPSALNPTLKP